MIYWPKNRQPYTQSVRKSIDGSKKCDGEQKLEQGKSAVESFGSIWEKFQKYLQEKTEKKSSS